MMRINAETMTINYTDYSCHIANSCRTCLTNHIRSISHKQLSIASGADTHTYTNTRTRTHTNIHTETILRNQAHAGQQPAHAQFKSYHSVAMAQLFTHYHWLHNGSYSTLLQLVLLIRLKYFTKKSLIGFYITAYICSQLCTLLQQEWQLTVQLQQIINFCVAISCLYGTKK